MFTTPYGIDYPCDDSPVGLGTQPGTAAQTPARADDTMNQARPGLVLASADLNEAEAEACGDGAIRGASTEGDIITQSEGDIIARNEGDAMHESRGVEVAVACKSDGALRIDLEGGENVVKVDGDGLAVAYVPGHDAVGGTEPASTKHGSSNMQANAQMSDSDYDMELLSDGDGDEQPSVGKQSDSIEDSQHGLKIHQQHSSPIDADGRVHVESEGNERATHTRTQVESVVPDVGHNERWSIPEVTHSPQGTTLDSTAQPGVPKRRKIADSRSDFGAHILGSTSVDESVSQCVTEQLKEAFSKDPQAVPAYAQTSPSVAQSAPPQTLTKTSLTPLPSADTSHTVDNIASEGLKSSFAKPPSATPAHQPAPVTTVNQQLTAENATLAKKKANQLEAIRRMREQRESQSSTDAEFLQRQRNKTPSGVHRSTKASTLSQQSKPVSPAESVKTISGLIRSDSMNLRNIQKQRLGLALEIGNKLHFSGRLSSLSTFDIKRRGELLARKHSSDVVLASEQQTELNVLLAKIEKENIEFRKAEEGWIRNHSAVYDYIPLSVSAWAKRHIEKKCASLVRDRSRHFQLLNQITWSKIDQRGRENYGSWLEDQLSLTPDFKPVMIESDPMVYKTGHVLHLQPNARVANVPFDLHHNPLSSSKHADPMSQDITNHPSSRQHAQAGNSAQIKHRWINKSVPLLREDTRALELAAQYEVDFLVTASALECIASSAPAPHMGSWEIPINCVDTKTDEKQLIILEKPLPKKTYTPKTASCFAMKHMARSMITRIDHPTMAFSQDSAQSVSNSDARNEPVAGLQDNKHLADRRESVTRTATESVGGTTIDVSDDNLVYALWSIGKHKMLVRMSLAGYVQDSPTTTRVVSVSAKPEYLPTCQGIIGPEEETVEETARWWVRTLLRPNALLLLARCDMIHNTMRFELRDILGQAIQPNADLCEDESTYNLHTAHSQTAIYSQQPPPALHSAHIPLFKTSEGDPWPAGLFPPSVPMTIDEALAKLPKKKYCFAFAREGICPAQQCPYQHVAKTTLIEMAEQGVR
ncbi:hypothetical protein SARC_09147, partial [Sphaeroforma arctica JP610]